jgi:ZIP family zinc transporter
VYDLRAGMRLSLAIALHNLPEGISVAAPLWYATHRRGVSAGVAFLSGLAEPIGALLAYCLLAPVLSEGLLNAMTLAAAGMMCWVSVAELLFGGFELEKKGCTAAGFAVGVCGMTLGIALLA